MATNSNDREIHSSNTRATIYTVIDGRVNSGNGNSTSLREQIADFATNGRKDRENNVGYDNSARLLKIMAVSDSIGYHYTESRAINSYNHIDFSDANTKAILSSLGYGKGNDISNCVAGKNKVQAMKEMKSKLESKMCKDARISSFSVNNVVRAINKARQAGNTQLAQQLQGQLDFYRKNGLNENINGGNRAYGRALVSQYMMGEDITRGVRFYQMSGRAAIATVRFSTRMVANTAVNIATSKPVHAIAAGMSKATGIGANSNYIINTNTKKARKEYRKNTKTAVSNKIRKKSAGEKLSEKRQRKQAKNIKARERAGLKRAKLNKRMKGMNLSSKMYALTKARYKLQGAKINIHRFKYNLGSRVRNSFVFKMGRRITAPFRFIYQHNPINFFNNLVNAIKRKVKKTIGTLILIAVIPIVLPVIISGVVSGVCGLLAHFATAYNPANMLADALGATNYMQLIINETSVDLAAELELALENDAQTYYLSDDTAVPSDNLAWTKQVDEAEVTKIYSTEKGVVEGYELPGVSANLQAICSMAHKRFLGEIDFNNYFTVKGYVYMMYIYSHDALRDANGDVVYGYEDIEECEEECLYEGEVSIHTEDATPEKAAVVQVTRPKEICSNVYIHGYSREYNSAVNKKRAEFGTFLTASLETLGAEITPDMTSVGVFANEVPYDACGKCDHYTSVKVLTCRQREHKHNGSCFHEGIQTCSIPEHEHSDSCYTTYYICLGHCGGHISPSVTLTMDMTYENLAKHDAFAIPRYLDASDFSNTASEYVDGKLSVGTSSTPKAKEYKTFEDWQKAWTNKVDNWGFTQYLKTPAEWLVIGVRNLIDWFIDTFSSDATATKKDDVEEFGGWVKEDGSWTSEFKDLPDIYGTYYVDDDPSRGVCEVPYGDANELWEGFDVTFPTGAGVRLTKSQIKSLMKQIKEAYPTIGQAQLDVIEEALSEVGNWTYSLKGHTNGYYHTGGITDCSGFVGGVIYRTLGIDTTGMRAAHYNGSSNRTAGSAISHSEGGTSKTNGMSYTGHVVIYLGHLSEGIPGYTVGGVEQSGPGYYIVHCSSGDGWSGSVVQRKDSIDNYPQTWNYW